MQTRRLRRNHSVETASRILSLALDTDKILDRSGGADWQDILRTGSLRQCRLVRGLPTRQREYAFASPGGLWDTVDTVADSHALNWLVCHDLTKVFTCGGFWQQLGAGRYRLVMPGEPKLTGSTPLEESFGRACLFCRNDPPSIIGFENQSGVRFVAVDLQNYTDAMPLAGAVASELSRWVENTFGRIVQLVREHDFGRFRYTVASQAWHAFRHSLDCAMPITHDCVRAKKLVRAGYYGGGVRQFKHGRIRGRHYQIDVNGLYPWIMRERALPFRLLESNRIKGWKMTQPCDNLLSCVARVRLKSEHVPYPVRMSVLATCDDTLAADDCFSIHGDSGECHEVRHDRDNVNPPINWRGDRQVTLWLRGNIETVLCGPELQRAFELGHIVGYGAWSRYELDGYLRPFIERMDGIRKSMIQDHDKLGERYVKQIMRGVFGKFGQREGDYKYWPRYKPSVKWGTWHVLDAQTGALIEFHSVGGHCFEKVEAKEQEYSLPAVSAWVASYARVFMADVRERMGETECAYQATDSLILGRVGFRRACELGLLDETTLGKFKLQRMGNDLEIRGTHSYTLGRDAKRGAVKGSATRVGKGSYQQVNRDTLAVVCRAEPERGLRSNKKQRVLTSGTQLCNMSRSGVTQPFTVRMFR